MPAADPLPTTNPHRGGSARRKRLNTNWDERRVRGGAGVPAKADRQPCLSSVGTATAVFSMQATLFTATTTDTR